MSPRLPRTAFSDTLCSVVEIGNVADDGSHHGTDVNGKIKPRLFRKPALTSVPSLSWRDQMNMAFMMMVVGDGLAGVPYLMKLLPPFLCCTAMKTTPVYFFLMTRPTGRAAFA